MTEPEFRIGQLVKAEWGDGRAVIGMVEQRWRHPSPSGLSLDLPLDFNDGLILTPKEDRQVLAGASTFTVLKEPPIEEPIGRWALVLLHSGNVMRRGQNGYWYPWDYALGGGTAAPWSRFAEEVLQVLYPGLPQHN